MLGLVPQSIMNWITLLLTTLMCRLRTGAANEDEAFVLLPEYDEDDSRFKRVYPPPENGLHSPRGSKVASGDEGGPGEIGGGIYLIKFSRGIPHLKMDPIPRTVPELLMGAEQTFFCVNATHYIPCTHVDLTDADSEQTLASASQVFHCGPRRCCEVGGDSPCTYRCEHLQPSLDYDHPNLKWTFPKIQPKARKKRRRKEFPEDMSEYVPHVKKISIKTFVFEYEELSEEDAQEISSDGWKPSYRKNCPGMKLIAATSIPSTAAYLSSTFSTFTSPTAYDDLSVTFNVSVFKTEHQNISIDTATDLVSSTSTSTNITMTEEYTQESSAISSMDTLLNESSLTTAPPIPTTTRTTSHTHLSKESNDFNIDTKNYTNLDADNSSNPNNNNDTIHDDDNDTNPDTSQDDISDVNHIANHYTYLDTYHNFKHNANNKTSHNFYRNRNHASNHNTNYDSNLVQSHNANYDSHFNVNHDTYYDTL
uniref:Uncharacterized protein n=1 Tax=Timema cristinae TaxID=61476 RepID=A0A7R9CCJ8_TIMCR|nr:unnamed protein product [Timema cristinae]